MAILCREVGLLFIMRPRTGCTAVGRTLCNELSGEYIPSDDVRDGEGRAVVQKKHSTLADLLDHGLIRADEAERLYKVTTVRNPFDSVVSLYVNLTVTYPPLRADPESWVYRVPGFIDEMALAEGRSFEGWVLRRFRSPTSEQRRWLPWAGRPVVDPGPSTSPFVQGTDHVMRFERLQSEFDKVLAAVGVDRSIRIPRINVTTDREGRDYRTYYTRRARRVVAERFKAELDRFGYTF